MTFQLSVIRRLFVVQIASLAVLFAVGATYAHAQEVRGTVFAAEGSRLAGANVTATGAGGVRGTVTNVEGEYVIALPAAGDYVVQASMIGYETQSTDVTVEGTATVDFFLEPLTNDPIVVTHVDDSGENSLRAAITLANETPGTDLIVFDIDADGQQTINIDSALPMIIDPLVIDGTSQAGATCGSSVPEMSLMIRLVGSTLTESTPGLLIGEPASGSTVRGLVIEGFPGDGILIAGGNNSAVECSQLVANGTQGAQRSGVRIADGDGNRIGGNGPGQGNQLSANFTGIWIGSGALGNSVYGNHIGTDLSGNEAQGNLSAGVAISGGSNNRIGGPGDGEGNLISGNERDGISIGTESSGNTVQGNLIGTNRLGDASLPNFGGIWLVSGAARNTIGGIDGNGNAVGRNVVSGNSERGVRLEGEGTTLNELFGNFIGVAADGSTRLGNGETGDGIEIIGADNNLIGVATAGNVISGNAIGVYLEDVTATSIAGNYIGTDSAGVDSVGNSTGLLIFNSSSNVVGDGNVISGNGTGIRIFAGEDALANFNRVENNYIGTNAAGTAPIPNDHGIHLSNRADDNLIGGVEAGNVISGNRLTGINIIGDSDGESGDGAHENRVLGNFIGTNAAGTSDIDEEITGWGVFVAGTANEIGGALDGEGNVISGHDIGVEIEGVTANGNKVLGNRIGTDAAGQVAVPNDRGIVVDDAVSTTIGQVVLIGEEPVAAGNVISGNTSYGIDITGAAAGTIHGNVIGLNATATAALPNGRGVNLLASEGGLLVGGFNDLAANIVAGNSGDGIFVGLGSDEVQILRNYIGTNKSSTAGLGNGSNGIQILDAAGVQVGEEGAPNVISGNGDDGIEVNNSTGVVVQYNLIGTNAEGTDDLANAAAGIRIDGSSDNTIGGLFAGNVISGNGAEGIITTASSSIEILGNKIGTDINGSFAIGNELDGVYLVNSTGNVIGGFFADAETPSTGSGAGNLISGNGGSGVHLFGPESVENTIIANSIGTDLAGTASLPNHNGVYIQDGSHNRIGGAAEGEMNVIAGNSGDGVLIIGGAASNNRVLGNYIGVAADGFAALGNNNGVRVDDGEAVEEGFPSDNQIGGAEAGDANLIAHNSLTGVAIVGGTGNSIRTNSIHSNGLLGIDLGHAEGSPDSVTANDDGDADSGANSLQNFPVLNVPEFGDGSLAVSGTLSSLPSTQYAVDLFANESCDVSGHGEGRTYLGSVDLTTDGSGLAQFNAKFGVEGDEGAIITATATDPAGNTSEFSKCPIGEITAPYGYLADIFAEGFDRPQGLAVDGAGNLIVAASGSGEIFRVSSGGIVDLIANGFSRPIGLAVVGTTLLVSDLDYNGVYEVPLLSDGLFTVIPSSPLVSIVDGPTHLVVGPDDNLYASVVRGSENDQVVRIDLDSSEPEPEPVITFNSDTNPQGLAFDGAELFASYQFTGEVRRTVPGEAVEGSTLPVVLNQLESPGGLGFGLGGQLYVATRDRVMLKLPDQLVPAEFLTGLSGDDFNNLFITDAGVMYVADRAAGRIIRVAVPRQQRLEGDHLVYKISANGNPTISDGTDFTAIHNAFSHWANVETASVTFEYGGTDPANLASAADSVNLVTFTDNEFLFPSGGVLAVAAKTIVFDDEDDQTGIVVDADIVFNPAFVQATNNNRLTTNASSETFDIESIATHEVGHVLGLVHSGVPYATMFFVMEKGIEKRTLETDDRAWLSHVYPEDGSESNTGAIEGTVINGDTGEPIGGALLIADFSEPGHAVHAYSDVDGSYHIPGLQEGDYRVLLRALNGNVWGTDFRPRNVSERIRLIATNTNFPGEWWNLAESSDPTVDLPEESDPVAVNSTTTGIDFLTNRDITPPTVVGFSPAQGASNVPAVAEVIITFSEPVVQSTVESAFSMVDAAGAPVGGSFTFLSNDQTVVFTPAALLVIGGEYTFELDATVQDKSFAGNTLAEGLTATFTVDSSAPTVTLVNPDVTTADVYVTSDVVVVFSEAINPSTLEVRSLTDADASFALVDAGGNFVPGAFTFTVGNTVATFTPIDPLLEGEDYSLFINDGSTANPVTDLSGNPVEEHTSGFSTAEDADPSVIHIAPDPVGDQVFAVTTPILVDFSEPMETSSVTNGGTFSLIEEGETVAVAGTFEFLKSDTRLIFRPDEDLGFSTTYTVTLTTGITDKSLAPLLASVSQTFTTAAAALQPTITAVSPPAGVVGTTVVISGAGFDPDPSANTVTFDGVEAVVTSSTLTSIVTSVPVGVAAGGRDLIVEVGGAQSNAFSFGVVEPIDPADGAVARISSETTTRDADFSPDGALAYLTNPTTNSVSVLHLATATIQSPPSPVPVGETPLHIAVTPDGSRAYVTNFDSHTVTSIDLSDFTMTTIPVGLNPVGVAVSPDGSKVYVAEYTAQGISIIDADPNSGAFDAVVARISSETANSDMKLSPDGTLAFVAGNLGLTIFDLDPDSPTYNSAVARISSETETKDVALSPDGAFAAVSTIGGEVLIIAVDPFNPIASAVVARISSESDASAVEFSPDGGTLFVTNFTDGTVTPFEISEGEVAGEIDTAGKTEPKGDPDTQPNIVLTPGDPIEIVDCAEGAVVDPLTGNMIFTSSCEEEVAFLKFSLTPDELLDDLLDYITDRVREGRIQKGHGNALLASVRNAQRHNFWGRTKPAVNNLEAFLQKVDELAAAGDIDAEVAEELRRRGLRIIDAILGTSKAGGADEGLAELPDEFALRPNYPNPFNPTTTIEYDIPGGLDGPVHVRLEVYNVLGQRVAVLVNEEQPAGRHQAVWDGRSTIGAEAASGVYLFRIEMGSYRDVRKMTLLR